MKNTVLATSLWEHNFTLTLLFLEILVNTVRTRHQICYVQCPNHLVISLMRFSLHIIADTGARPSLSLKDYQYKSIFITNSELFELYFEGFLETDTRLVLAARMTRVNCLDPTQWFSRSFFFPCSNMSLRLMPLQKRHIVLTICFMKVSSSPVYCETAVVVFRVVELWLIPTLWTWLTFLYLSV